MISEWNQNSFDHKQTSHHCLDAVFLSSAQKGFPHSSVCTVYLTYQQSQPSLLHILHFCLCVTFYTFTACACHHNIILKNHLQWKSNYFTAGRNLRWDRLKSQIWCFPNWKKMICWDLLPVKMITWSTCRKQPNVARRSSGEIDDIGRPGICGSPTMFFIKLHTACIDASKLCQQYIWS